MVYLNTTALQDYAPTASWYGIVESYLLLSGVNGVVLSVQGGIPELFRERC